MIDAQSSLHRDLTLYAKCFDGCWQDARCVWGEEVESLFAAPIKFGAALRNWGNKREDLAVCVVDVVVNRMVAMGLKILQLSLPLGRMERRLVRLYPLE